MGLLPKIMSTPSPIIESLKKKRRFAGSLKLARINTIREEALDYPEDTKLYRFCDQLNRVNIKIDEP